MVGQRRRRLRPERRRLAAAGPPPGGKGNFEGRYSAVWTGKEMLVWGPTINEAYKPVGDRWRQLPLSPYGGPDGIVVWTGREMIGWGGGCCGDVVSDGVAFNPVANSWRKLARSPLAGSQHPLGAWTGRELLLFVSGFDPDGKPWPARLARAAAYNPATDSWRRIAPLPEARAGASAVWDGRELLVVGGTGAQAPALAAVGFAYDPASNRWRRLAPMPSGRFSAAAVWTGRQLLLWGGGTGRAGSPATASHGLAYDPQTDRWSTLPQAPLAGRDGPSAVWTGSEMIVWGGTKGVCRPGGVYGCHTRLFADGAAFRPTSP